MCSQYRQACVVEDYFTEESSSGRESAASSCFETELEFEHFQNPTDQNNGRVLYLKACEFLGVVPIKRLLHQLGSKEICIRHRNLNDIDCKAISNALLVNKSVTTLDLSNNLITHKGVLYLASAMVERDLVRVLVLAGNQLAYSSAEIFSELLERSQNLTVLDLSSNNIDDKGCLILAKAVKKSKTLVELELSHNKLTENAGIALNEALASDTLQRVNLSWNLIRHGVDPISTALSTNRTLRIFDLSWNGIDDLGARALIRGLESNAVLQELNLSNNNVSDVGFIEIVKVLEKCRLQKLDISRNRCFGLNKALEMLLRLLEDGKTELRIVNIGQIPLTQETTKLLEELKTSSNDVIIYHGYTNEDSYQATAPKHMNPYELLRNYAITHQLHSFQLFRALGQSDVYRETISREEFVIGLQKLNVFDDHQINDVVDSLDHEENGLIEYSEFMTIFSRE